VTSLAFSPDGAYLTSGMSDSTILVWRVDKAIPKLMSHELGKDEMEAHWGDLASDDAAKAYQASWELIAGAQQSVPMLSDRLKPAPVVDANKIQKWIAALDNDEFAVRTMATKELAKLGGLAEPPIEKALKQELTAETRRRLEQILEGIHEAIEPHTLRTMRAVMVLEKIGSSEAQKVLQGLAEGAPGVRETKEAKAVLECLKRRKATPPD
jgi:hypothetical protein